MWLICISAPRRKTGFERLEENNAVARTIPGGKEKSVCFTCGLNIMYRVQALMHQLSSFGSLPFVQSPRGDCKTFSPDFLGFAVFNITSNDPPNYRGVRLPTWRFKELGIWGLRFCSVVCNKLLPGQSHNKIDLPSGETYIKIIYPRTNSLNPLVQRVQKLQISKQAITDFYRLNL